VEIAEVVAEKQAEESRERLELAAFQGWQNYIVQTRDKRAMSFAEWCRMLGLKPTDRVYEEELSVEECFEKARRIAEMDKKRKVD